MSFMAWIIDALNDISSWFYEIYLDVYSWVWPFSLTANLFLYLCYLFNNLAWYFNAFSSWVSDVQGKIGNFLSWSTIWSYILSYVPNLTQIRDWFYSWWTNVQSVVASWWSATSVTVQGWINTALQYVNSVATAWNNFWNNLWPQLTISFNSLKSAWDNFWTVTFPTLVSFSWLTTWWSSRLQDVQGLIGSAFTARASLWAGWQEMRDNVVNFFTDPVEFIWERFTDWFLGPEG
jgi:hypothetical protein